jgi:CRP-like cAMP-binding protein
MTQSIAGTLYNRCRPDRGGAVFEGIPKAYPDGFVLFEQGDPAADMYVIVSGEVRISRTVGDGEATLTTLGPGEFFGEIALFDPGPRSATAVTVGPTELEIVDRSSFVQTIENPAIWEICRKMSLRIRRMDELLESAGARGADRSGAPNDDVFA